MFNEEVYSEYTEVEQKRNKKHENDCWRLLSHTHTDLGEWDSERPLFLSLCLSFPSNSFSLGLCLKLSQDIILSSRFFLSLSVAIFVYFISFYIFCSCAFFFFSFAFFFKKNPVKLGNFVNLKYYRQIRSKMFLFPWLDMLRRVFWCVRTRDLISLRVAIFNAVKPV